MENINKSDMMTKTDKLKAMEKESNITLVSTAVSIISFFLLLYAQNLYIYSSQINVGSKFLTFLEIGYFAMAVISAGIAIFAKKKWLWEYAIFGIIVAAGYYLMHYCVAGIPGLANNYSPFVLKLAKIISTKNMAYALWAVNVVYCVLSIALHSVRYNKIKKTKIEKTTK